MCTCIGSPIEHRCVLQNVLYDDSRDRACLISHSWTCICMCSMISYTLVLDNVRGAVTCIMHTNAKVALLSVEFILNLPGCRRGRFLFGSYIHIHTSGQRAIHMSVPAGHQTLTSQVATHHTWVVASESNMLSKPSHDTWAPGGHIRGR